MHHEFGVTIVSDLATKDVQGTDAFPHVHVIDLRPNQEGGARAFEEETWRRLRSYFIGYDQLPMNMQDPSPRQENALLNQITDQAGNVLIVTGQVAWMARFCRDFDIPYCSRELAVFEFASGDLPIQIARPANGAVRLVAEPLDSMAG